MVGTRAPNILFIVSDEERRNGWLEGKVDLPAHARLRADGISFDRYYTHASPCSPSRASLYTGSYLAQHGIVDNVSFPAHTALDPTTPTIGSLLGSVGYHSAYKGKWHLSHSATPTMTDYGYQDWEGNDYHFTGSAWTGRAFDPVIVDQGVSFLEQHADSEEPWFLTVALVNPHDIMWFPADQPSHQAAHPEDREALEFLRKLRLDGIDLPELDEGYPYRFDQLPANFDDDLHTKPEIQRAWRTVRNTEHFVGDMSDADDALWLRQLDYYAWLHECLDQSLANLLGCLDRLGLYDDTVIVYTSDHGDACGSHGLRAKLPCVYEEVMGVPLIIKAPGVRGGARTSALASHVDLAATIASVGGVDIDEVPTLSGVDLSPVLTGAADTVRDHVFFSQDSAQSELLRSARYAVRGFFDGRMKYARYYGVGGGIERDGRPAKSQKRYDLDAAFDDHDHEWYDLENDPHELVNLAADRSRRSELRSMFDRLLEIERSELG